MEAPLSEIGRYDEGISAFEDMVLSTDGPYDGILDIDATDWIIKKRYNIEDPETRREVALAVIRVMFESGYLEAVDSRDDGYTRWDGDVDDWMAEIERNWFPRMRLEFRDICLLRITESGMNLYDAMHAERMIWVKHLSSRESS